MKEEFPVESRKATTDPEHWLFSVEQEPLQSQLFTLMSISLVLLGPATGTMSVCGP